MQNVTGLQIKQVRKAKNPKMTQADLASALQLRGMKIDRAGVAKIEGGFRQVSDVELVMIAQALNVPPGDLLQSVEEMLIRYIAIRNSTMKT